MKLRTMLLVGSMIGLAAVAQQASAKGVMKGAAKGAVVGHVLGHHGKAGAVIGAVHGHHHARMKAAGKA